MQFLKLTKNISGKVIRVNPGYVISIDEGEMKEDPESKPPTEKDKDKKPKRTLTILSMAKGKDLFVTETPDEIEGQLIKIKAIRIEL